MKSSKKSWVVLILAILIILGGSIPASMLNTGLGATKVNRISFETENGTLSGLLYMPNDASETNPKPTIIVTHGYLNSAEMQDANAIELSRRGYVVLALDQYDHGHSDYKNEKYSDTSFFGIWLPFWQHSMHDAVAYMYDQPYVLKDSKGNGIIGVTGHSMGGFGSTMALAMDEQEFLTTGKRKIYCGLTEGSDFQYTSLLGITAAVADQLGGGRIMGKVAAQYDEFFFSAPTDPSGTVRHKDYVSTPDGMTFLQQTEAAKANTWYNTSDGGRRIIYEPAETHPWNHFSTTTTAYAIEFYTEAFKDYQKGIAQIPATDQIWLYKELAECFALIGFIMLIIAVASLLLGSKLFAKANSEALEPQPSVTGAGGKFGMFAILFGLIVIPAAFFNPLMDGGADSAAVKILFFAGCAFGFAGIIGFFTSFGAAENKKSHFLGSLLVILAGAALAYVSKHSFYTDNTYFTAPGVNSIAYWTIVCAAVSLLATSVIYLAKNADKGLKAKDYGVTFNPVKIILSLIAAILTVAISYGVLFLVDMFLKVDFRIWTFAFKTFDFTILPAVLRYLPTFLAFYIVSTISITINTNTEKMKGLAGYLLAIALNAGGPILWLALQYGTLFTTGVAAYPGSALSGIVLVAMVPTLSIAAIISRNLYKKTGNIWAPAFINAILMTIMTLANTMVAFK